MNIIPCEYGKYASVDADFIIEHRTKINNKGEFTNKYLPIYFDLVPVIGWIIDEYGSRTPVLINNEKHGESAVIIDVKSGYWWWLYDSGKNLSSLTKLLTTVIESAIDYRLENPHE